MWIYFKFQFQRNISITMKLYNLGLQYFKLPCLNRILIICYVRNEMNGIIKTKILNKIKVKLSGVRVMVFNPTSSNISAISWWSVLVVEETGVLWVNHQPAESHWQTWSHNVVSSTSRHEPDSNTSFVAIGTDCTGSYKSNYHTIMTTTTHNDNCILDLGLLSFFLNLLNSYTYNAVVFV